MVQNTNVKCKPLYPLVWTCGKPLALLYYHHVFFSNKGHLRELWIYFCNFKKSASEVLRYFLLEGDSCQTEEEFALRDYASTSTGKLNIYGKNCPMRYLLWI